MTPAIVCAERKLHLIHSPKDGSGELMIMRHLTESLAHSKRLINVASVTIILTSAWIRRGKITQMSVLGPVSPQGQSGADH